VKNWKSLLLVTVLCAALAHPTQAAQTIPSSQLLQGLYIKEGDSLQTQMTSVIGALPYSMGISCETFEDPRCLVSEVPRQQLRAFMLPCSDSVTLGCIEEIYALDESGKKYNAQFTRVIAPQLNFGLSTFSEDLATRRIAGSGLGNLWSLSGLPGVSAPLNLVVQASLGGWRDLGPKSTWTYTFLETGIAATSIRYGNYRANGLEFDPITRRITGGDSIGSNGREDDTCVATESAICFDRQAFPKNFKFGFNLRLPNSLDGFFHGRINSPIATQTDTKNGGVNLTIEANPVRVPFIRERIGYQSWTKEMIEFADRTYVCSDNLKCGGTGGGLMYPGVSGDFAFTNATLFLPIVKDKATGSADFWSVRTLEGSRDSGASQKLNSCISREASVAGIVTTNAMVYSAGPPAFNESAGSLDYKVLSPHFDSQGAENLGTYDLLLRSDFARCIYGFSSAPIRAEISIVGSGGEDKVATTVINEKDGWMYLSAKGFTYSSPTLKVKMSQDKVVEVPATQQNLPSNEAPKQIEAAPVVKPAPKKSITCVKGKTVKKVTGTIPKCPKGWKKK
jgi:hypothetical protein